MDVADLKLFSLDAYSSLLGCYWTEFTHLPLGRWKPLVNRLHIITGIIIVY